VQGLSHFLVSAVLGYEFGIGVRSGCFCAHPYILHLLGLSSQESDTIRERMLAGDRSDMPGLIRLSFGLYNTRKDVDVLADALRHIVQGEYRGQYAQNKATGEFTPRDWQPDYSSYFTF
jgi:selenocysteine lyase/cysteine desulfurase